MIVLLVHPLASRLRSSRYPSWAVMAAVLISTYAIVIGLVGILLYSAARLATILPSYRDEVSAVRDQIVARVTELDIGRPEARAVLSSLDLQRLGGGLVSILSSAADFGAEVVLLLSTLLFLGIEARGIPVRLKRLADDRPAVANALRGFARRTRRFIEITGVFAIAVGTVDFVFLAILGVPLAALWGLLAAVSKFVPYIGFLVAVIPPALLALLSSGWQQMLAVIIFYVIANAAVAALVRTYVVGQAVDLSTVMTLLSVVFWTWVLGPMGAVLAVPLTLLLKALLIDPDPRASWAQVLIGRIPRASDPDG
jgi:AI-2 transport protein TqsA